MPATRKQQNLAATYFPGSVSAKSDNENMLTIRSARWPHDAAALSTLDTAFVTERIYRPVQEEFGFRLVQEDIHPPLYKRYAFSPSDLEERRQWDYTAVAEEEGVLAGFAAAQYVAWNRRVVLWHLYVAPDFRREGVGTRLLQAIDDFARSAAARCLWLETQNVNYPAIQFYRRSGFTFCGFDATLYDPQTMAGEKPAQEEAALFFARSMNAIADDWSEEDLRDATRCSLRRFEAREATAAEEA